MVLLVFRLNKHTTTSATFTLGKELKISKLIFKGFNLENCSNIEADANDLSAADASELPIYLQCSLFGDNEVCFYQGKNAAINAAAGSNTNIGNFLPLGGIKAAREAPFRAFNLTIYDRHLVLPATTEITFILKQIQNSLISTLTSGQAFGTVNNNADEPSTAVYDHGMNLYFEAVTTTAQDGEQVVTIANSS